MSLALLPYQCYQCSMFSVAMAFISKSLVLVLQIKPKIQGFFKNIFNTSLTPPFEVLSIQCSWKNVKSLSFLKLFLQLLQLSMGKHLNLSYQKLVGFNGAIVMQNMLNDMLTDKMLQYVSFNSSIPILIKNTAYKFSNRQLKYFNNNKKNERVNAP